MLEKSVEDSISIPEKGPNSKKFGHFYITIANYIPFNDQGINIKPFGSSYYELGRRYKRKFNDIFSAGYDLSVSVYNFKIRQDSTKAFPVSERFDKEKIKLGTINLELYQRLNFGQRGNYMGIFMDIGIKGEWNFLNKYITWNNLDSQINGKSVKVIYMLPEYIKRLNYSLVLRAGINNIILWFNYTLADIIDQDYYSEDFRGFWFGMQVGLHK